MKKIISIKTFMIMLCCTANSFNLHSNELSSYKATQAIAIDEKNLDASFKSIRKFLNKLNTSIEKLLHQKFVNEEDIQKYTTELADAQRLFAKTIAQQREQHKHNNRQEHSINKALAKAQKNLKTLSKKTIHHFMRATDRIIIQALQDEVEIQTTKKEDRKNFN